MVTVTEARNIAEKYAKDQGEVLPGIRYGVGEMQEFKGCYYFHFKLNFVNPPEAGVAFGGAPGFTVDKITGEPVTIAFWQLTELK